MADQPRAQLSNMMVFFQDRVTGVITLIYLAMVLICFLMYPILYVESARTPFMGAFVEHTLMVNTTQPTQPGSWELSKQIERFGYQVQAIDGQPIENVEQMRQVLRTFHPGDQISLTLLTPEKQTKVYPVKLQKLPGLDQISFFVIPYFTGLIYLACGLYVFGVRRYEPAGRAFALFASSCAVGMAGIYDSYTTYALVRVWTGVMAIMAGAMFNLAMVFPETSPAVKRYPFLRWLGYVPAILAILYAVPTIHDMSRPEAYVFAWRAEFILMGLAAVLFVAMSVYRQARSASPVVREQARLLFWGALIAFSPMVIWLFVTSMFPSFAFSAILMLPMSVFPVLTGYAIIRYRLLNTDYLLSRMMVYTALTALAVGGYALLTIGLSLIFSNLIKGAASPLVVGIMVVLLALGLNPLRTFLQTRIDVLFFRGQIAYREQQQAFSRELTQALDLSEIVGLLRRYIDQALQPSQLHIFAYDPPSGYYIAMAGPDNHPTSDVRFPVNSALVQALAKQRESLFITEIEDLPAALQKEQARLSLLGAQLFVPMPGRKQLIGWLALGARLSGEPYNSQDLNFMEVLSDQTALAAERSQVVADLERRVRETNVLTRVAQGVSFTVTFDDILELLSAQAAQVLPARDFRVTLYDSETSIFSHAFFLENDERLSERENRPLPVSQGLEWEVLNNQRPLITDDYERECRGRGMLPTAEGIYAWMGVPLNAGAETIGVISVGSRDPAILYTNEQRDLLQAIADQASGAIVKARLLEESENRARQLAMLNQISLGLTSTLTLDPKHLLTQILESAAEILNCEAGTLFLVDPQTDEVVFEVVIGPVAANLLGRRLPPGAGLVGEAVQTGKALIVNDAKRRKEWFEKTDIQTGYDTQDMLIVPMRVQDRVIGVIEVLNKRNGAPFILADQELLTAFTSQATIAIENARLYNMTDQALADRVEELSIMQRIDRELNASLDIERAMRITLDWAMRQSQAEAGLVGAVQEKGVRVVVSQGYPPEVILAHPSDNGDQHHLPIDLPGLKDAIESGHPQHLTAEAAPNDQFGLLPGASMQIVIPIRRETDTIGVMLLESAKTESSSDELVDFLSRLSDHAAIAIANAQLYEEVKEANLAKSRFVSFVAHELKNPMASIKGYTELVAGGMAGPVNEMQSSFLGTVRANVDRMNTIVTDLNDLTKIQVGNMRLEYRVVQVPEALDEVIRSLKRQIEDKKQTLTLSLSEGLPVVWADPSRLNQILTNLVSNAQKYTPEEGRIDIGAERYFSDEEALAGVEFVRIWVKDSGIGITEEDQKKIFQQYFRTDTAKEMASGTGLGLNITKSLIEMQGGRIWFDSKFSEGTTFSFTVPVAEAQ